MVIDWRYFSIQLYKWKLWKLLSSCQQFSMLFIFVDVWRHRRNIGRKSSVLAGWFLVPG